MGRPEYISTRRGGLWKRKHLVNILVVSENVCGSGNTHSFLAFSAETKLEVRVCDAKHRIGKTKKHEEVFV